MATKACTTVPSARTRAQERRTRGRGPPFAGIRQNERRGPDWIGTDRASQMISRAQAMVMVPYESARTTVSFIFMDQSTGATVGTGMIWVARC